ncbi:MAG: undecaprenyl/decaprenyl-phosphate alpha-N-acetylglucosaminyl 1-phosphate transferase [Bacteroidetes bacterium]|nr:undecaprenyl/decaprenyl-phosphate alpha-N-acetylglucosaminyl 1-phosphate transferase [Bacteroidota bacterium]
MEYLLHFVTPFGLALVITLLLIPVWIKICGKWKLFDEPDSRKHHTRITPSMGGIAIVAGIFTSFLVFADLQEPDKIRYLFGAVLILFFTGFFDDLMNVPPIKKLALQCISACAIYFGGFKLIHLYGILWIHEVPELFQLPITLFLVVMFTNAFNFIDGADGLAGCLGVIATSCMGALFFHYGKFDYAVLTFCITGALLGFLFFNFSPARIFMGDTGSLVVGFMISVLSIELINSGASQPEIAVSPAFIYAVLFVPLFDISRVFMIRLVNGNSPFHADRNHLHHLILSYGFGHRSTALIMSAISLLFISLQQLLPFIPVNLFIACSLLIMMLLINPRVLGYAAQLHHAVFGNSSARNMRMN